MSERQVEAHVVVRVSEEILTAMAPLDPCTRAMVLVGLLRGMVRDVPLTVPLPMAELLHRLMREAQARFQRKEALFAQFRGPTP